eukprot:TRINITY_DN34717_c0_g1_i1.p1 TRINITY_DN34717_c0_g1~~TRINITY_DN34717_c0_g1_i1.p1  ORF type:complete len:357 (-),score=82.13 TRINITY_DN34717_c0_g1_i1:323-1393(-)
MKTCGGRRCSALLGLTCLVVDAHASLRYRHSADVRLQGELPGNAKSVTESRIGEKPADEASGMPEWGVRGPEGGSIKKKMWEKEPTTFGAYIAAIVWVSLIAGMPQALHIIETGPNLKFTKVQIVETTLIYTWLIGGLYLFTNVLLFQSPHFDGNIRSLSLIEAVYLFSQIVTTVGYGDITPAYIRGQVFVGIFVVLSFMLIAGMVSQLAALILEKIEKKMHAEEMAQQSSEIIVDKLVVEERKDAVKIAATPLIQSSFAFGFFVVVGTVFFSQYPGEGKTVPQAIYMSFITLSSVGFGAFTPVTQVGMVFGAYWMLFGVTALAAVISSTGAFVAALKAWELENSKKESARSETAA